MRCAQMRFASRHKVSQYVPRASETEITVRMSKYYS